MFGRLYQLGYVATDVDAAIAGLRRRLGPIEFVIEDRGEQGTSGIRRGAKAYVGETMLEILEPRLGVPSLYSDHRPKEPEALVLHHFGHLVESEAEFDALRAWLGSIGAEILSDGEIPALKYIYADLRAGLGPLQEYVWLKPEGADFYAAVPRNAGTWPHAT